MAQVPLPESVARTIFGGHFGVPADWALDAAPAGNRFVVKPDHAIGKRGKNGLLGINLSKSEAEAFIGKTRGTVFNGVKLERFLVTPYIEHEVEYYVSLTSERDCDILRISENGGVDIEENWGTVREVVVPLEASPDLSGFPQLEAWLETLIEMYREYNLCFLEVNPLTIVNGELIPLDFKARIDDCALFKLQSKIDIRSLLTGAADFTHEAEREIATLDSLTGASLKFKLLNENGSVWPLIAGGGASIVSFDTLVDLGLGNEVAFYGEYSGNPTSELTYAYSKAIIELMLAAKTTRRKTLIIAGANANFTDIAATFEGIIKTLDEHAAELKRQNVKLLVRRGGPNSEVALAAMHAFASKVGLENSLSDASKPFADVFMEVAR